MENINTQYGVILGASASELTEGPRGHLVESYMHLPSY